MAATEDELQDVPEIGPIVASNIVNFFRNIENIRIINNLIELGVIWESEPINTSVGKILNKKILPNTGRIYN